jgi:hypothetical protein
LAIVLFVLLAFCPFPLAILLFVLLSFSFGHCAICPFALFLWPFQRKRTKGQMTQWPKEKDKRTNNTMAKGKGQKDK